MTTIFIIHGSYGHPEENWFPWLKTELEKDKHKVFIPKFPTPEGQTLHNWLKVFKPYEKHLDENTIIIGHSLGVAFLLSVLEKRDKPIKAAFFVSGCIGSLNNPLFDNINKSFTEKEFDWKHIKEKCPKIVIFHSNNDPYVPLEKAKELAKKLTSSQP
jgi:predicted alpha/beta hydrolase family esterase